MVRHYDSKLINYYQVLGGTIGRRLLLPICRHHFPVAGLTDTFYLLLLSRFCTVGLYVLFAEFPRKIPAFTVNLRFDLKPIQAIILAFLFFGESKTVNTAF